MTIISNHLSSFFGMFIPSYNYIKKKSFLLQVTENSGNHGFSNLG